MPIHTDLAASRWFTLTYAEQLGNIGSDVERVLRAIASGDKQRQEHAAVRTLELLELTLADSRHPERQGELRWLRELLGEVFRADRVPEATAAWLREYFLEWGIAARAGR